MNAFLFQTIWRTSCLTRPYLDVWISFEESTNKHLIKMSGGQILWAIVWFLVLLFLAWPIGFFCAGWYVCLTPFEACIDGMKSVTTLLRKGVTLPFEVSHRMVKGKSYSSLWSLLSDFGSHKQSISQDMDVGRFNYNSEILFAIRK